MWYYGTVHWTPIQDKSVSQIWVYYHTGTEYLLSIRNDVGFFRTSSMTVTPLRRVYLSKLLYLERRYRLGGQTAEVLRPGACPQ